jgi:hypothetical protein
MMMIFRKVYAIQSAVIPIHAVIIFDVGITYSRAVCGPHLSFILGWTIDAVVIGSVQALLTLRMSMYHYNVLVAATFISMLRLSLMLPDGYRGVYRGRWVTILSTNKSMSFYGFG